MTLAELAKAGVEPTFDQKQVLVPDRHPWGAVLWESDLDGTRLTVAAAVVADPNVSVKSAWRAASASVAPTMAMWNGARLPGRDGYPLSRIVGTGVGLITGVVAAAYMAPVVDGATVEMATVAAAATVGYVAPVAWDATHRARSRWVALDPYDRVLRLSVAIGGYLMQAPSLSATVTQRLRAILWEAPEVAPEAVAADLEELADEHHIPYPPPAEEPLSLLDPIAPVDPRGQESWSTAEAPPSGVQRPDVDPLRERTRSSAWDNARARHEQVKDAYAAVITDPLNALDHSALFDVANHRTERFLLALGECDDQIVALGLDTPADRAVVDAYAAAVRRLALLWADAYGYAERVGDGWLPAGEASTVRKAGALLRTAADDSATVSERGVAAGKAKEALQTIRSFRLPQQAMQALGSRDRPEGL